MPLIDVHQHIIPDIYKSQLARVGVLGSGENPWPAWSIARQRELMDEMGIDAVLLSIASPGAYFGDIDFTRLLVHMCNEVMARMVGDQPDKFGAMAFVSLPDVEAACRDVAYAIDVLKLDGINLQTHTANRYLGHPEEDELYAELDRRNAVVFVHPQRPQITGMAEYSFPAGYTELTFDTTRAIANMLYNGTLEKYPNIRFIMPHMGGVTPFLLFRLSGLDDDPKLKAKIPAGVKTYLNRLYYDVAQSPSPLALRALMEVANPSRVLFGTDYPSARNVEKVMRDSIAAVSDFNGFDDALRGNVMAGNARALLPRFAGIGKG
jgi:6-methylsalicylate decarboxylase